MSLFRSSSLFLIFISLIVDCSSQCTDLVNPSTGVSDCTSTAYLCNDSTYYDMMTTQCPATCGRCSGSSSSTATCVDLVNPSTGVSDCPSSSYLCNDSTYYDFMTTQCNLWKM
ncbi:hypothetical protein PRIPAC_76346 [Pristionchus pacificus]|uniref:ShK domain-containing protein n=1 Tax=Pristionchus pacificus TaxID=54126 RepID=A0A2A6B540_PRIPA|nr:hypothetical protein PRIPAC_76346 [Pristionchus pacificus]|eukprot:PDM60997.1 ShK domain-containing protein [Pristionchus pacificus]